MAGNGQAGRGAIASPDRRRRSVRKRITVFGLIILTAVAAGMTAGAAPAAADTQGPDCLEKGSASATPLSAKPAAKPARTSASSVAAAPAAVAQPHLVVSKTACPSRVAPGGFLTYTITALNDGTADAALASLVDTVPVGVSIVDVDGGTPSLDETTVTWDLGTLSIGETEVRHLVVQVDATSGSLRNRVTLTAPGARPANFVLNTRLNLTGAITHGSAYGADIDLLGSPLLGIDQLGPVATVAPPSPDVDGDELLDIDVPLILGIDALTQTSVSTVDTLAESTATSQVVGVNLLGGLITADAIRAVAQSTAGPHSSTFNFEDSTFTNLRVNGQTIEEVNPNTTVNLTLAGITVAQATLFEKSGSSSNAGLFNRASGFVNMIHVRVLSTSSGLPAGTEIIIGHAQSDAKFPGGQACLSDPASVSGLAFSAFVEGEIGGVPVLVVNEGTAKLPRTGGSDSDVTNDLSVLGVSSATASNTTSGSLHPTPNSTARSRIEGADVLGGLVTAGVIDVSSTSVGGATAHTDFATTFADLNIAGIDVDPAVAPNTTIAVPQPGGELLLVILNEQSSTSTAFHTEGTVNAIHIFVLVGSEISVEIIVGSAHSDAHGDAV